MKTAYIETPVSPVAKSSLKQQFKKYHEVDINRMGSGAIIAHLAYRHRVGLLVSLLVVENLSLLLNFFRPF